MITIEPRTVGGTIMAPSSKSSFQRLLALATLSESISTVSFETKCEDVEAVIDIIQQLGCVVQSKEKELVILPAVNTVASAINCGESGLAARMFAPVCAVAAPSITVKGTGTLLQRDMQAVKRALVQLGVQCELTKGGLPLVVTGPIQGDKTIEIEGASGSQLLTGLLISLPFVSFGTTVVKVHALASKPYIDLTLALLREHGIDITNREYKEFTIPGGQRLSAIDANVEGDWSGAAFFLVAGAIAGRVVIEGLDESSKQADRAILEVLVSSGAKITREKGGISVRKSALTAFCFDATDCPDLFPPLVVLAAYCKGVSQIRGVGRLKGKESDRATVLVEVFAELGISIAIEGEVMYVEGGAVNGGSVSSHHDHRIAMAAAIAALGAKSAVTISHSEAVCKSYPLFFKHLSTL